MTKLFKTIKIACVILAVASPAFAQIPTFDSATFNQARQTSETTNEILDTSKDVLETVTQTLTAVTGDRSQESGQLSNVAVGNGFSVSSLPSFDSILSGSQPNFGGLSGDIQQIATTFINGLQLVRSLSGQENSGQASDQSYENLLQTVTGVSALINGAQSAVTSRTSSLEQASSQIGTSQDVKGSIDQNSQIQVQTGLVLNELIGVMNGQLQSLQADNQRKLTDISNTVKALKYE